MERVGGDLPSKTPEELSELERRFLETRLALGDRAVKACSHPNCDLRVGGVKVTDSHTLEEVLEKCIGTKKTRQRVLFDKDCMFYEDWR